MTSIPMRTRRFRALPSVVRRFVGEEEVGFAAARGRDCWIVNCAARFLATLVIFGVFQVPNEALAAQWPDLVIGTMTLSAVKRIPVAVSRASDVVVTEAQVDAWLVAASTAMQMVEISTNPDIRDVSCPIEFYRAGAISSFSSVYSQMDGQKYDELEALIPGGLKVVRSISNESGVDSGGGQIIGLTKTGRQSVVIDRVDGQTVLHELSHSVGGTHTPNLNGNPSIPDPVFYQFIMYPDRLPEFDQSIAQEYLCRAWLRRN